MQYEYFVSVDGDDGNEGTRERPFASVAKAQSIVRSKTKNMQQDIIVSLLPGTHFLEAPLVFDAALGDSGKNGHRVIYRSDDSNKKAVVSGGKLIKGWQLHDKTLNIWRADIGEQVATNLYVNGRTAETANVATSDVTFKRTESGYEVDDSVVADWKNPSDVSFVYTGVYPWSEAIVRVDSVDTSAGKAHIVMRQPAFGWAQKLYKSTMPDTAEWEGVHKSKGLDLPTIIQNDLSFLREPGTFVFERGVSDSNALYYIPVPDEDMSKAEAIIPMLETLVEGRGSLSDPLENISFNDLIFSHATWLKPYNDGGYIHYHGVSYFEGGRVQSFEWAEGARVTIPVQYKLAPSAIDWQHANHLEFTGNTFRHIGTGGLALSVGSSGNRIQDNVFEYIAGAGISIGTESASHGPGKLKTANNRIERNKLSHIGHGYHGSPAILAVKTQDTLIAHNKITHMPHAGIVVYGGGGTKRLRILNNYISHTLELLADGGGIYVASTQGTSAETGALIDGNVVQDTITPYNFGIYTDYGAAWTTISNNIIFRADNPVAIQTAPPLMQVTVRDNFWDSEPYGSDNIPDGIVLENNTLYSRDTFEERIHANDRAAAIMGNAGMGSSITRS